MADYQNIELTLFDENLLPESWNGRLDEFRDKLEAAMHELLEDETHKDAKIKVECKATEEGTEIYISAQPEIDFEEGCPETRWSPAEPPIWYIWDKDDLEGSVEGKIEELAAEILGAGAAKFEITDESIDTEEDLSRRAEDAYEADLEAYEAAKEAEAERRGDMERERGGRDYDYGEW